MVSTVKDKKPSIAINSQSNGSDILNESDYSLLVHSKMRKSINLYKLSESNVKMTNYRNEFH